MKFFRVLISNITIAMSLALIVVAVLHEYNPMMGFLQSKPALLLILLTCVCSIASCLSSYVEWRNEHKD